jgi:hypothetical protein
MNTVKVILNAVIIGLLIAILYNLTRSRSVVTFASTPQPIQLSKEGEAAGAIFSLKSDLECTAGPGAKAEEYSQDLTPGGLCGVGEFVHSQMKDYSIADGIGGSLLERT